MERRLGGLVVTTFDIVPTALAVKAMRDNGYKNSAYALAELMDNSIQAEASIVELLCADEQTTVDQRVRQRLRQIAVLDNGVGMEESLLQRALQFGNGSRLDVGKHTGMGRFGMGLPSASVSQCRRVDVWSWQSGPDSALYSYIDLDEIEQGKQETVPEPVEKAVPQVWRQAATSESFGESGTLVVWGGLDRCLWRTSRALIENSEALIGRMYRKWIVQGQVKIRMANFLAATPLYPIDKLALPNDPGYLMAGTSTPAPYRDIPMFAPFPDQQSHVRRIELEHGGARHTVTLTFSLAKDEARKGARNAGASPAGQHAGRNMGVSIVRAGRELDLDASFINGYDPTERWWGVEVAFEPGLDDVFGVANNKQSARNFSEAAKINLEALIREHGGSIVTAQEALRDENSPIEPLLVIVHAIQTQLKVMRDRIKTQTAGRERVERHGRGVEAIATKVVEDRKREGKVGQSDAGEALPEEERVEQLSAELEAQGQAPANAHELASRTISIGFKYQVNDAPIDGGAFFSVQPRGGVLLVTLNTDHPAYDLLKGARRPEDLPTESAALRDALEEAHSGLELLLFAWARYEDEQSGESRDAAQSARYDWGRMARRFLSERASD